MIAVWISASVTILLWIVAIALAITFSTKKDEDESKKSIGKSRTAFIVLASVATAITVILYVYSARTQSAGLLTNFAQQVYDAKTEPELFQRCDSMFDSTGDQGMIDQYKSMKSRADSYSVKTLCGNYAKSILGKI
jgi:hypothetical protein